MRRWITFVLCCTAFVIFIAGCDGSTILVASAPTERPIVPTRVIPTATETIEPTLTSTATPTTAPSATATISPVPTDTVAPTPTDTVANPPTLTPSNTPTITGSPTLTDTPVPLRNTPVPTPVAISQPTRFERTTAYEQPPIIGQIAVGDTVSGTLDDTQPILIYTLNGSAGQVLDLTLEGTSGDLDPLLIILTSKGQEIARNDDRAADDRNSMLTSLHLPENDQYIIVVTRYLGVYGHTSGDYNLSLTEGSEAIQQNYGPNIPLALETPVTGHLSISNTTQIYNFRASAGDVVDISVITADQSIDPLVTLTDNLGNLLITDDDISTRSFDSMIENYVLPETGYYTIIVSYWYDTANPVEGDFTLLVHSVSHDGFNGEYALNGLFNPADSRTIRADGRAFLNINVGDVVDDQGNEQRLQGLLTFELPPGLMADQITNVDLDLQPCYTYGNGFDALGEMTIYSDPFGDVIDGRVLTRPFAGARIIATVSNCDSIDLSDLVRTALNAGETRIQLRFTFRDPQVNGQYDYVRFADPRLRIHIVGTP